MKDLTKLGNNELEKTLEFAKEIGDTSLQECLNRLKTIEENYQKNGIQVETNISTDFAPKSFYFSRTGPNGEFYGNGGIIFHGKHDNGGDGGSPTFSVCLTPTKGWAIHT